MFDLGAALAGRPHHARAARSEHGGARALGGAARTRRTRGAPSDRRSCIGCARTPARPSTRTMPRRRLAIRYVRAGIDPRAGGVGADAADARRRAGIRRNSCSPRVAPRRSSSPTAAAALRRPRCRSPCSCPATPQARRCPTMSATPRRRQRRPPSIAQRCASRSTSSASLLWGSLVAAALLLGYMALRLARQMRTGSDDA